MAPSKWNLDALNFALGYADGLVSPQLRRKRPTHERYRRYFDKGLSDAAARRPFDPPDTDIPPDVE